MPIFRPMRASHVSRVSFHPRALPSSMTMCLAWTAADIFRFSAKLCGISTTGSSMLLSMTKRHTTGGLEPIGAVLRRVASKLIAAQKDEAGHGRTVPQEVLEASRAVPDGPPGIENPAGAASPRHKEVAPAGAQDGQVRAVSTGTARGGRKCPADEEEIAGRAARPCTQGGVDRAGNRPGPVSVVAKLARVVPVRGAMPAPRGIHCCGSSAQNCARTRLAARCNSGSSASVRSMFSRACQTVL